MNNFIDVAFRQLAIVRLSAFFALAVGTDGANTGFIAAQYSLFPIFIFIKNDFRHAVLLR